MDLVDPENIIQITYRVAEEDHDGYCSDQQNQRTKTYNVKKTFFLLNGLLDDHDIDIAKIVKKSRLYKLNVYQIPEGLAHFCCGSRIRYTIIGAKIKNYIKMNFLL